MALIAIQGGKGPTKQLFIETAIATNEWELRPLLILFFVWMVVGRWCLQKCERYDLNYGLMHNKHATFDDIRLMSFGRSMLKWGEVLSSYNMNGWWACVRTLLHHLGKSFCWVQIRQLSVVCKWFIYSSGDTAITTLLCWPKNPFLDLDMPSDSLFFLPSGGFCNISVSHCSLSDLLPSINRLSFRLFLPICRYF